MALPISARARVLPSMSSTSVLVADGWTVDIRHLSSTVPVNVSRTWAGKQAYQDLASCSAELTALVPAGGGGGVDHRHARARRPQLGDAAIGLPAGQERPRWRACSSDE